LADILILFAAGTLLQVFTPLAAAATIGVWGVVLQSPKEVASLNSAPQLQQ